MALSLDTPLRRREPLGLALWPPVFAVSGTGMRSSLHSHHAWHLMVGRDGPFRVRRSARGRPLRAHAALMRPDVPHAADADGREVSVIFVSPESEVGAQLRARRGAGVELLDAAQADRLRAALRPRHGDEPRLDGALRALAELGIGAWRPRFDIPP